MSYLINFYDSERERDGRDKIPINIVHTDNCPNQYKDRHNFIQVATSCDTRSTTIIHKFAQKYNFKGSWDATGKLVKQAINRLELKNDRIPNAMACYIKLGQELSRDGEEKETKALLEYEDTGDIRVLENTTFRTQRTFVGFGTEDKDEYEKMTIEGKKHVVFTDHHNIKDTAQIKGTQQLFQVQGAARVRTDGDYDLHTFKLPCSCDRCMEDPHKITDCLFLQSREWKREVLREIKEIKYDKYKVSDLKNELSNRQLPTTGKKEDMIKRLMLDDIKQDGPSNQDEDDMIVLTREQSDDEEGE